MSEAVNATTEPLDVAWNNHGRHPSLELRHTVDDVLRVATDKMFLGLRAMLHRNRDTMIVFSEAVKEVKLGSGQSSGRGVILTDKHLYVVSLPHSAIFAPSAAGGCFTWKEFGRLCTVKTSNTVVFQFIGGMVALQFSSRREIERLSKLVFSTTGVPSQEIDLAALDAAKRGGQFSNSSDFKAYDLESVSTASRQTRNTTTGASSIRAGSNDSSSQPVPVGTTSGAAGTNVENMLRFILAGSEADGYETLFPTAETQTELRTVDQQLQAVPQRVDRACSPIRFLPDGSSPNVGGGGVGFGGYQPHTQQHHSRSRDREDRLQFSAYRPAGGFDDFSDTASSYSDFDHNDVWRSLHGTVVPREGGGGNLGRGSRGPPSGGRHTSPPVGSHRSPNRTRGGHSNVSPNLTHTPHIPLQAASAAQLAPPTAERRIQFDIPDADLTPPHQPQPSEHHDPNMPEATLPPPAEGGAPPALRGLVPGLAPPSQTSATGSSGGGALGITATSSGDDLSPVAAAPPMMDKSVNLAQSLAAGGGGPPGAQGGANAAKPTSQYDAFLGVLAPYKGGLMRQGIDSVSRLVKLSPDELNSAMDAAGIAKPGHRTLLSSKVNLARQAKQAKKATT